MQSVINETAELARAYTPAMMAYRAEMGCHHLVLAARASATLSLTRYGQCAGGKWDKSDAFFRIQRRDTDHLLEHAPGIHKFAAWSQEFDGRHRILPLTSGGFAGPVETGEGHNQGDPAAGEGFQAVQAALEAKLTNHRDMDLQSDRGPLPGSRFPYSDGRLFLAVCLVRLVMACQECEKLSRMMGQVVHPSKLEYIVLQAQGDVVRPVPEDVPGFGKAKVGTPQLVGVPLLHMLYTVAALSKLIAKVTRIAVKVILAAAHPLLKLPAYHAYALSSLDNVASGVLMSPADLGTLQAVKARYEQKFGRLDPRWSAFHYEQVFLSGSLTLVSLQRVSHLAVAAIQPYPAIVGARPCPYCHSRVVPLQPHLHGDCAHAEVVISLAEATVLEHEAWGPQTVSREFLQRGIVRDKVRKLIYGFSATGRIPLLAQCPPPQWAVHILSATAQWFELGGCQHPHRIRSPDKTEIVRAYLNEQGQQVSAGH